MVVPLDFPFFESFVLLFLWFFRLFFGRFWILLLVAVGAGVLLLLLAILRCCCCYRVADVNVDGTASLSVLLAVAHCL